ncbi:MAG: hypothetical protein AB9835_09235 [Eubacteriales bacterium]
MYMRKYHIRPIVYLALCAAIIFILFVIIHITGFTSASGLEERAEQAVQTVPYGLD